MANGLFSVRCTYFIKIIFIAVAILVLLLNTHQHFTNPFLIIALLATGYYLGKITCSIRLKDMGVIITLLVFILMNIVHSYIDGISLTGQSFFYQLSVIGGHEAIRQPTLYIVLLTILEPFYLNNYKRAIICFTTITIAWLIGLWLGKVSGATITHTYDISNWIGYSIFILIGDIVHHFTDEYRSKTDRPE